MGGAYKPPGPKAVCQSSFPQLGGMFKKQQFLIVVVTYGCLSRFFYTASVAAAWTYPSRLPEEGNYKS